MGKASQDAVEDVFRKASVEMGLKSAKRQASNKRAVHVHAGPCVQLQFSLFTARDLCAEARA